MKIYNNNSDFKRRIDKVLEFMEENDISFDAVGDKIIITDESDNPSKDGVLLDGESLRPTTEVPPCMEYKIGVLESYMEC